MPHARCILQNRARKRGINRRWVLPSCYAVGRILHIVSIRLFALAMCQTADVGVFSRNRVQAVRNPSFSCLEATAAVVECGLLSCERCLFAGLKLAFRILKITVLRLGCRLVAARKTVFYAVFNMHLLHISLPMSVTPFVPVG